MQQEYPDKVSLEFVRVMAEEPDFGSVYIPIRHGPGNGSICDHGFFRFDENEKIVEHWIPF